MDDQQVVETTTITTTTEVTSVTECSVPTIATLPSSSSAASAPAASTSTSTPISSSDLTNLPPPPPANVSNIPSSSSSSSLFAFTSQPLQPKPEIAAAAIQQTPPRRRPGRPSKNLLTWMCNATTRRATRLKTTLQSTPSTAPEVSPAVTSTSGEPEPAKPVLHNTRYQRAQRELSGRTATASKSAANAANSAYYNPKASSSTSTLRKLVKSGLVLQRNSGKQKVSQKSDPKGSSSAAHQVESTTSANGGGASPKIKYYCSLCPHVLASLSSLSRHLAEMHPEPGAPSAFGTKKRGRPRKVEKTNTIKGVNGVTAASPALPLPERSSSPTAGQLPPAKQPLINDGASGDQQGCQPTTFNHQQAAMADALAAALAAFGLLPSISQLAERVTKIEQKSCTGGILPAAAAAAASHSSGATGVEVKADDDLHNDEPVPCPFYSSRKPPVRNCEEGLRFSPMEMAEHLIAVHPEPKVGAQVAESTLAKEGAAVKAAAAAESDGQNQQASSDNVAKASEGTAKAALESISKGSAENVAEKSAKVPAAAATVDCATQTEEEGPSKETCDTVVPSATASVAETVSVPAVQQTSTSTSNPGRRCLHCQNAVVNIDRFKNDGNRRKYEVFTCCGKEQWYCTKPECFASFDSESNYLDHFKKCHQAKCDKEKLEIVFNRSSRRIAAVARERRADSAMSTAQQQAATVIDSGKQVSDSLKNALQGTSKKTLNTVISSLSATEIAAVLQTITSTDDSPGRKCLHCRKIVMKVDLVELAGKGKKYEVFTCCQIKQWFCPKPQCKKAFDCKNDYEDHFEEYHPCEAAMNQKRRSIDLDKVTKEKEQLSKTNIADALKRWANSAPTVSIIPVAEVQQQQTALNQNTEALVVKKEEVASDSSKIAKEAKKMIINLVAINQQDEQVSSDNMKIVTTLECTSELALKDTTKDALENSAMMPAAVTPAATVDDNGEHQTSDSMKNATSESNFESKDTLEEAAANYTFETVPADSFSIADDAATPSAPVNLPPKFCELLTTTITLSDEKNDTFEDDDDDVYDSVLELIPPTPPSSAANASGSADDHDDDDNFAAGNSANGREDFSAEELLVDNHINAKHTAGGTDMQNGGGEKEEEKKVQVAESATAEVEAAETASKIVKEVTEELLEKVAAKEKSVDAETPATVQGTAPSGSKEAAPSKQETDCAVAGPSTSKFVAYSPISSGSSNFHSNEDEQDSASDSDEDNFEEEESNEPENQANDDQKKNKKKKKKNKRKRHRKKKKPQNPGDEAAEGANNENENEEGAAMQNQNLEEGEIPDDPAEDPNGEVRGNAVENAVNGMARDLNQEEGEAANVNAVGNPNGERVVLAPLGNPNFQFKCPMCDELTYFESEHSLDLHLASAPHNVYSYSAFQQFNHNKAGYRKGWRRPRQ